MPVGLRVGFPLWLLYGLAIGTARAEPEAVDLANWIRQYEADADAVSRFFNLPVCVASLERQQRLQSQWLERLRPVDFAALPPAGKLDYLLFRNKLQKTLDSLERQRRRNAEIDFLIPFCSTIQTLDEARWRAAKLDAPAAAGQLDTLSATVKQLITRLQRGKKGEKPARNELESARPLVVNPTLALRAAEAVGALRDSLKGWHAFYEGFEPQSGWWLKKPCQEAFVQLDAYGKLLREELAGCKGKTDDPLVGDPIGAEALMAEIRYEFLPYAAAELIAIGQRELAWCEGQMRECSRAMRLGDDWKAALAKVKADFVPPGAQGELVAQIAREATQFVESRRLVEVPPLCAETWRLTMLQPDVLKTIPYAAYGGQQMLVAYAKDEMPHEDKLMVMRGNNRHFTRLVTPHELIPGHHLQGFYAARYNTQRRTFSTPFYVEGWALYWELRLWELGWAATPEDRIGMLFWRMTRAARIVVSLKFHLGQMKPDEMVNFLVERVGHEKLGATSEVRRFIGSGFSPLYQCGYLLGGLQLRSLHAETVGSGKLTERQFHDAVLRENTMPIELLRAGLLGLPLSADAASGWRFADGLEPGSPRY